MGKGRWEYAAKLVGEDGSVEYMATASAWHWEPYTDEDYCRNDWPNATAIVKRWNPFPGEWVPTSSADECHTPHPVWMNVACSLQAGHPGDHVDGGNPLVGQWPVHTNGS